MTIKKVLICSIFSFLISQDITGNYKLSGLSAVYYDFVRYDVSLYLEDNHGFGITALGDSYHQGEAVRAEYQQPYPESALIAAEVQLLVNFYEDGSAYISEGSTYPTSTTEDCISTLSTLPITGDQSYSSNLNSGSIIPSIDILGLPSKSVYAGYESGSASITSSPVFDVFPETPTSVETFFPIDTSSVTGNEGEMIPANSLLPGTTAGYVIQDRKMVSMIERNSGTRPSLYLEWHATDGPINESGLGDIIDQDEDEEDWDGDGNPGDGTDFDSIYGLESIRVMKINLGGNCGSYSYPIAGDFQDELENIIYEQCMEAGDSDCETYASEWIEECINPDYTIAEGNDVNNLYAFDSTPENVMWGGLVTWNSALGILEDDSDHDYDDSCADDGDTSDCSGRLTFSYTPQCVPSISARYFMAELTESCEAGDVDECGVCFGEGKVDWYMDNDRDGLGDPNNYYTNCLPGYCADDESLNYSDCEDAGYSWNWLSVGVCSDGQGNVYENGASASMGDFDFCNYLIENEIPEYENATWSWDRGFVTNNLDLDDECENVNEYTNCDGSCVNDTDGDLICDEDEIEGCTDVNSCNFDSVATNDDGSCDGGPSDPTYDCDGNCVNDEDSDSVCDENEINGCTEETACNYNENATDDDNNCEYAEDGFNCDGTPLSNSTLLPQEFSITQAYPNPFNPTISIEFGLPSHEYVDMYITTIYGEIVEVLISEHRIAGHHSIKWNATRKPSGIYIVVLKTAKEIQTQKIVLLK